MASKGKAGGPDTTDSIDIAMGRARGSDQARDLLTSQSHLIFTQELLARADLRHRSWQIIGERVGAILKVMTAAVGAVALIGITAFFWSAHRASGMVMDPFSVPPTMASQGLSGPVVAQQLFDKIAALESTTQSARAASSYENSLSDSKGVVVPYAGVSLGEIRREARDWLGSENHVSGDVVQLPGGRIAISFRALGQSGRVDGDQADLNGLLDKTALAVFQATQPYRHAIWLYRHGGTTDQLRAILGQLGKSPDPREQAWALHGMANMVASSFEESKAFEERAMKLHPGFLPALSNLPFYAKAAGRDEEAYRLSVASAKGLLAGEDDYTPSHAKHYGLGAQANAATYKGDLTQAAKLMTQSAEFTADDVNTAVGPFGAAIAWAAANDFPAAKAQLAAASYLDPGRRADVEKLAGPQPSLKQLLAVATDDFATQANEALALVESNRRAAETATNPVERTSFAAAAQGLRSSAALYLAQAGRVKEAAALIDHSPTTNDGELRIRAFVAAMARDPSANEMFADAAARTLSLPAAQIMWAEALVRTGRFAEAEQQARKALALGPNSADAAYWLGEALIGQGKARDAAEAFRDAARTEPHWGRLHLALAGALWQSGKRKAAVETLRAASNMALNPDDKARLMRMVRSANRQILESRK